MAFANHHSADTQHSTKFNGVNVGTAVGTGDKDTKRSRAELEESTLPLLVLYEGFRR